jgi:hypothetical protein
MSFITRQALKKLARKSTFVSLRKDAKVIDDLTSPQRLFKTGTSSALQVVGRRSLSLLMLTRKKRSGCKSSVQENDVN